MSDATESANRGSIEWTVAAAAQRMATPDHGDLHTLGGEMVHTLRAQAEMARVLARQVGRFGEGRELYDDEGMDTRNRMASAGRKLELLLTSLTVAGEDADAYWAEIGHIGLATDTTEPEEESGD